MQHLVRGAMARFATGVSKTNTPSLHWTRTDRAPLGGSHGGNIHKFQASGFREKALVELIPATGAFSHEDVKSPIIRFWA